jgi:hypothetical protein
VSGLSGWNTTFSTKSIHSKTCSMRFELWGFETSRLSLAPKEGWLGSIDRLGKEIKL